MLIIDQEDDESHLEDDERRQPAFMGCFDAEMVEARARCKQQLSSSSRQGRVTNHGRPTPAPLDKSAG